MDVSTGELGYKCTTVSLVYYVLWTHLRYGMKPGNSEEVEEPNVQGFGEPGVAMAPKRPAFDTLSDVAVRQAMRE